MPCNEACVVHLENYRETPMRCSAVCLQRALFRAQEPWSKNGA